MEDWIKDVEYYLMPARNPVKGYEKQYQAAYECWRAAWEKFRTEIGITKPLSSDGFFLPHEIGALFYRGECVGLSAFTYSSLISGPAKDLSWWDGWSPESFEKLCEISQNGMFCSQFTVNPKFAGKGQVVRWKEIVFLYSFMRFNASIGEVMAGNMNLTKGVNNACGETFGGTLMSEPFLYNFYGVELQAQLVAYEKKNIKLMMERRNIEAMCDDLWSKRIHLSEYPITNNEALPLRKAA